MVAENRAADLRHLRAGVVGCGDSMILSLRSIMCVFRGETGPPTAQKAAAAASRFRCGSSNVMIDRSMATRYATHPRARLQDYTAAQT